jgi:hypothetical protein
MKHLILLLLLMFGVKSITYSQCASQFSFATNSETVNFSNQSSVSNAHYFWNFGDGTGSNLPNPIHAFPESGRYSVSLFAKDTVSNCSSYNDQWIDVIKTSTSSCHPAIPKDSIILTNQYSNVYIQLVDTSASCNLYSKMFDGGYDQNKPAAYLGSNIIGTWLLIERYPGRFVGRIKHFIFDAITHQQIFHRTSYKTVPFHYTSAKNYNSCSANFEFKVVSQDAYGQRILYTAMNKTATSYQWIVGGMTGSVYPSTDTVSWYYPYSLYSNKMLVTALSMASPGGCMDTLVQNIRIPDMGPTTIGVKEYSQNDFGLTVFPNPVQDKFIISTAVELDKITLINYMGQEVYVLRKPQLKQEIDLSLLPAGVYFVQAQKQQARCALKIIKQ